MAKKNVISQHKVLCDVLKMPTIQVFLMDGSSRVLNLVSKANTTVQQLHLQMMKVSAVLLRGLSSRPHYRHCPSVCLSLPCNLLAQKQKGVEKQKLV